MVGSGELDCMEFRPSPRSLEVQSALLQQLQEMNFYHKNIQLTDTITTLGGICTQLTGI